MAAGQRVTTLRDPRGGGGSVCTVSDKIQVGSRVFALRGGCRNQMNLNKKRGQFGIIGGLSEFGETYHIVLIIITNESKPCPVRAELNYKYNITFQTKTLMTF